MLLGSLMPLSWVTAQTRMSTGTWSLRTAFAKFSRSAPSEDPGCPADAEAGAGVCSRGVAILASWGAGASTGSGGAFAVSGASSSAGSWNSTQRPLPPRSSCFQTRPVAVSMRIKMGVPARVAIIR